jgi:hypothetical protein
MGSGRDNPVQTLVNHGVVIDSSSFNYHSPYNAAQNP